jgi:3-dehydroquinate synthase
VTDVVEVALGERSYPVVVGRGVLARFLDHVSLPDGAGRAMVVTQQPVVDAGHVAPVDAGLVDAGLEVHLHLVPDGEGAKDVAVLAELWKAAATIPLSRSDVIVAVGGGVVGDLAGFAAATYARGIAVIQVPTTLLAQVDAAIGGKTGINLPEGKNLVGAFHQPLGVVCDVDVLSTLPVREFTEGLGEVVKYGLIADPVVLDLIGSVDGDVRLRPDMLEELIHRSVAVKSEVVGDDEREGGRRAILNFGHTYGHAVETLSGYGEVLHGEAVAIGMVVALQLGQRMGRTPPEVVARGIAAIKSVGLPTVGPSLDREAVWQIMGRDKKADRGGVRFVLLDDVGAPVVVSPEPTDVDAVIGAFGQDQVG